jgi:hypothetical protein
VLLTLLRMATFVGLFLLFLQPQWRFEREKTYNSRVLVLLDTSGSMGMNDADPGTASTAPTRLQQVADALDNSPMLSKLRETHDVAVYQFNNSLERDRVKSLGKLKATADGDEAEGEAEPDEDEQPPEEPVRWREELSPTGTETRLGEALLQLIESERNTPVAGIILFTDGGQNAGASPDAAIEKARENPAVPVYVVGVGSDRKPINVGVYDLVAPKRAYPGDKYTVTGYIQAYGLAGRKVTVELSSREGADSGTKGPQAKDKAEGRQDVTLGADGEVVPVKFEITPDKTGHFTFRLQVQAPKGDRDAADNTREAEVEIVDRKNRVLLLAGGPMRDYQYLRTLLYRDRSAKVDILLQTAQQGISQEANKILDEFPSERLEMYEYDCIVAFDPNWQALRPGQIDLLENWVYEGGGLVVAAGPVYSLGPWLQDEKTKKVRSLYPVEFFRRSGMRETSTFTSQDPWPLEFTREGLEAEYLWLADTASASRAVWSKLPGVYSFCPVRGPKSGAAVMARFSDPRAAQSGKQPTYFAEQFYGSGRVFYMGSGETWRLRALDSERSYFDQFYTKLIRHVSQGRLLRGSNRGMLLVGHERYSVGNTVEVRAQLTNARLEPLKQPSVSLQVIPVRGGPVRTVLLHADPNPSRAGTFWGQFPVLQPGQYRLELPVPESQDDRLLRMIEVQVPQLEMENPQRNDALLGRIAKDTGGAYYLGVSAALDPKPVKPTPATGRVPAAVPDKPLVELLQDKTRTEIVPVAPNPEEEQRRFLYAMIGLCSLLCLEWLVRRLVRLA